MRDFFEHQDRALRKSGRLTLYFVLAVIGIVVLVDVVAGVGYYFVAGMDAESLVGIDRAARGGVRDATTGPTGTGLAVTLVVATLATLVCILLGSLYKTGQLRAGGKAVARMMGARQVASDTADTDERRLLNVVEEMAIASGTPVPPVYILDGERQINAFAAGLSTRDAIVCVTRGCLEKLDRDELQGVIAHEFSHILHGDMRINLRLIGILHGILVVGLLGWMLMRFSFAAGGSRRRRGGGKLGIAMLLGGLTIYLVGMIGVFFGNLIKAAVSRQREFLADASAVQYTRNPDGIAGALKRLAGIGSHLQQPRAAEVSHLLFGSALRSRFGGMLATHPPIRERIKRLDAQFAAAATGREAPSGAAAAGPGAAGFAGGGGGAVPEEGDGGPAAPQPRSVRREQLYANLGAPAERHVAFGRELVRNLDRSLSEAARNPFSARAVIYALLLDEDSDIRRAQEEVLAERADPAVRRELGRIESTVAGVDLAQRLPLLALCMPALSRLTRDQLRSFLAAVDGLIEADERTTLFEYALRRMLLHHLREEAPAAGKPGRRDLTVLLSAVCHAGAEDAAAAEAAFTAAATAVGARESTALLPAVECGWEQLDQTLDRLTRADNKTKARLLEACAAAVAADETVRLEEGELLRAIADSLDCPVPPLIAA